MGDEWYDPSKMKGTGIYDFVEEFATRMTSDQARAAVDGERYRREAWSDCLSLVTDATLRQILEAVGPMGLKSGLKGLMEEVLRGCGTAVHDLPHILIGLSLSYMGANPRLIRERIPEDWRK